MKIQDALQKVTEARDAIAEIHSALDALLDSANVVESQQSPTPLWPGNPVVSQLKDDQNSTLSQPVKTDPPQSFFSSNA